MMTGRKGRSTPPSTIFTQCSLSSVFRELLTEDSESPTRSITLCAMRRVRREACADGSLQAHVGTLRVGVGSGVGAEREAGAGGAHAMGSLGLSLPGQHPTLPQSSWLLRAPVSKPHAPSQPSSSCLLLTHLV